MTRAAQRPTANPVGLLFLRPGGGVRSVKRHSLLLLQLGLRLAHTFQVGKGCGVWCFLQKARLENDHSYRRSSKLTGQGQSRRAAADYNQVGLEFRRSFEGAKIFDMHRKSPQLTIRVAR